MSTPSLFFRRTWTALWTIKGTMTEHYTRRTESVTAWCNKCQRTTEHRVDSGRKGPCLEHTTAINPKPEPLRGSRDLFEEKKS